MLVTIGIPFFNNEKTLLDAIRSVFTQTFDDWELLLVNDGSTDRSPEIAQSVRSPKVRVLNDGINKGLPARLNQIAIEARGRYLARMDGDDMMCPERIERQVRFLEENPEVDLVDTGLYSIDEKGEPQGKRAIEPLAVSHLSFLKTGGLVHPAVMGRRSWFANNPYEQGFVRIEDRELWCRTLRGASFARIPEPLYIYRENLAVSSSSYLLSLKGERKVILRHGPRLVGMSSTLLLLCRSYMKTCLFLILKRAGRTDVLLKKRNLPLTQEERSIVQGILKKIYSTPVPGIDEAIQGERKQ